MNDDHDTEWPTLPTSFTSRTVSAPDADLFVRVGGSGTPVVLLHGYVETGDMWRSLAADLAGRHTVIVPDLRGLGRSSRPEAGYDKKTQARDVRAIVEALGFDRASIVGHDLGGMIAYAYAAQYPGAVERLVVMEAVPPGLGAWDEILKIPGVWHFHFGGPEAERLVEGRERIYFERFWNGFSDDPARIPESVREHYAAAYAAPGAMRGGFAQFAAFLQDAADNAVFRQQMLTMPVLAVAGARVDRSFGPFTAGALREVATDVREVTIPGTGHWLIEENPAATVAAVRTFLAEGAP